MAVDITLNTITTGFNLSKINENFERIDTALQDAVSRSGTSPNTMTAELDMNSNKITNLSTPTSNTDAATKLYVDNNIETSADVTLTYKFGSSTVMADPGVGVFLFDNATVASVTNLAFDATTASTSNPDISDYIATWDDSTNTVAGHIVLQKFGTPSTFAIFSVTTVTDNTGWLQVAVTHVSSSGIWSVNDVAYISFTRAGDASSGDLLAANNLSDVASASTSRTNLGLAIGSNVQAFDADNATASSSTTFTNKTFDANGTGNALSNVDIADLANGTDGELITWNAAGAPATVAVGSSGQVLTSGGVGVAPTMQNASGVVKQVVSTQTGAVATGTTTTPSDDTIPQKTEGDEYMTLTITPKNASNRLVIAVVFMYDLSTTGRKMVALHQDAVADALAASFQYTNGANRESIVTFTHVMAAATTSATTFKVRAGGDSGTLTFNGAAGARKLGGVMASSIVITEIEP